MIKAKVHLKQSLEDHEGFFHQEVGTELDEEVTVHDFEVDIMDE